MIEAQLGRKLDRVARRIRRLRMWTWVALLWSCCAALGGVALWINLQAGWFWPWTAPVIAAAAAVGALVCAALALWSARDYHWIARTIERRFPQLDSRLVTAVEQRADRQSGHYGYLQQSLIHEALLLDHRLPWASVVPSPKIAAAQLATFAAFVLLLAATAALIALGEPRKLSSIPLTMSEMRVLGGDYEFQIDPGNAEVERGAPLIVLARFTGGAAPPEATLWHRFDEGEMVSVPMSLSLDDPVFVGRVPDVQHDLTYHVEFDGVTSDTYRVTVFEYPQLVRADARLKYPAYTKLEETLVQDTRTLTVVEGTEVTLLCQLNKPVAEAALVEKDGERLELRAGGDEPKVYSATMILRESKRLKLALLDQQQRPNQHPVEFTLNVTPNRAPELKLLWPSRDVQVSPLEEVSLRAELYDDFGLLQYGVSYSIGGGETTDVVLGDKTAGKERLETEHLLQLEELAAQPDQLVSYHFWADDAGADGQPRRSFSDMFFAEVRPFEEIFRQGQQPPGGQQDGQQQQGQNAQQAQQLAELQKQIISGAWNLIRRENPDRLSPKFEPDSRLLLESQQQALAQAEELAGRLQDEQSLEHADEVRRHMQQAIEHLHRAVGDSSLEAHRDGLTAEQAAYQALLKLRAREHQVIRSNQQQGSPSSAGNRSQMQLEQLKLDANENRYEAERTASPQEDAQQRETRQVLNRLRELARRQSDLNEQLKQLQSALEEAETEEERDELRRELKRLRDQQQEILRDADELKSRMDRPANQQQMSESSQQMQNARENVRQASEALEEGRLSQAVSAGTRAQRELSELQEDFRRQASNRFSEEMRQMRDDAQQLDDRQSELASQLSQLEQAERKSLRDSGEREEIVEGLRQQQQDVSELFDQMQQVVEQAETAEPLLSRKVYDALREAKIERLEEDLDRTRQFLDQGFLEDAVEFQRPAAEKIRNLREDVEEAAESVLGDEVEALRRARDELSELANQLNQEIARNNPQSGGENSQSREGEPRNGQPQPGGGRSGENEPSDDQPQRRGAGESPQDRQNAEQDPNQEADPPSGRQQRPGDAENQSPDQPGQGRPQNDQQQPQQGGPGGGQPQEGEQNQQEAQQQQPGDSQSQQGGRQPPRQQQPSQDSPSPGQGGGRNQRPEGRNQPSPGPRNAGDPNALGGWGPWLADETEAMAPLTGDDYEAWTDRLRDVEEIIDDPELRAEAARIRDRAREFRGELKRHSREPQWPLVRELVAGPLMELRDRVAEELLRRSSDESLVPIDRDPVPEKFSRQVELYYERLGKGGQ